MNRERGNISNAKDSVSPHFQTPRRELKIRREAEYFLPSSRFDEGVWKCVRHSTLSLVFEISV